MACNSHKSNVITIYKITNTNKNLILASYFMTENQILLNNSAGRLLSILKDTAKIGNASVVSASNRNRAYMSVICEATKVKDTPINRAETLQKLFNLLNDIEEDLLLLTPIKRKNYQVTLNTIKTKLSCSFNQTFSSTGELIVDSSHIIRELENCADSLSELFMVKVIEQDELVITIDGIDALYKTVNSSDISKDLKFILLKKITSLKITIENYQFQGSNGIQAEVESFIGSIVVNKDKVRSEQEKNLISKTFNLLSKIITTASATKNLLPENIIEIGKNLLPPG